MKSNYQLLKTGITMPNFKKDNVLYMFKTRMDEVVMPDTHSHFKPIIENIISTCIDKENVCYITIDEKTVKNDTHRRGGIHCDFNWYERLTESGGGWDNTGYWDKKMGTHGSHRPRQSGSHPVYIPTHLDDYKDTGGMLLVSNHVGCKAYLGEFNGIIGAGGDCSNIDVSGLENEDMAAGAVYYINSLGIHEPLIIKGEVKRTLIRINFHPDYIFKAA